jgi:[protein-PII] uridylyltransferase
MPKYDHEFPELSRIMQSLPKPELAYLAAIFHDNRQGSAGGDHSELARSTPKRSVSSRACRATTPAWLRGWVRSHLILSVTAQKKDISDPKVLHEFAKLGGDPDAPGLPVRTHGGGCARHQSEAVEQLEGVAVREFYERTRQALRRGLESPSTRTS